MVQANVLSNDVQVMAVDDGSKSNNDRENVLNLTQARKILHISPNKMSQLVRTGKLPYTQDPLDYRVKLVRRKDVEALLQERSGL
jgi:Helix-turn-helix domain